MKNVWVVQVTDLTEQDKDDVRLFSTEEKAKAFVADLKEEYGITEDEDADLAFDISLMEVDAE